MGKVKVYIPKIIFIGIVCLLLVMTGYNYANIKSEVSGVYYLLNEKSKTYYERITSNSCKTNINGVSNIRINLMRDGYTLYSEDITTEYIDMIYVKQGYPTFRYIFDIPSSTLTIFSSSYENSAMGLTYIIEGG